MDKKFIEYFEIVEEIGAGGMAVVFKAVQKSLNRPVAIKELKKDYRQNPLVVQRFEREANIAASLQHEHIVHIYSYHGAPDFCIAMEYVDGVTLSAIIAESGPLPAEIAVMIALQVCSALSYAHSRGLVHRDVKPSNIMIKQSGEVKLMDFGVALSQHLQPLTEPGMAMGTPHYMSPEQVLGSPVDARADVFSLGIVLYEALTGARPFDDPDADSVTARIVAGKYKAPRRLNRSIPFRLQWVVKKCLKQKPARRYQTVEDAARGLGRLLRGRINKEIGSRMIVNYLLETGLFTEPEDRPAARGSASNLYRNILIAAGLIIALAAAAVAYRAWTRTEQQPAPVPIQTAPSPTILPAQPGTP